MGAAALAAVAVETVAWSLAPAHRRKNPEEHSESWPKGVAMRLAYICSSTIPSRSANSIHVMKMCQALQQEGYQTKLLAPQRLMLANDTRLDLWYHYGVHTSFEMQYIPIIPGLRGHDFSARATWLARRDGAELVYTRDLPAAAWASLLGLPTVCEAHSPLAGEVVPLYVRMLLTGRGFRRLVVISKPLQSLFLQQYAGRLREEQVMVAPDGVDLERFQGLLSPSEARGRLQSPPDQFTVGYAGHLYAGRGIELILALAQHLPRVQFLVMGGTDAAVAEYRDAATRLGCENLRCLGFIPNAELPLHLAACDVLLMPYQRRVTVDGRGNTAAWMSPMKMFEYMATARLIISSDLPVLREVLNEGNAVLCEPEDLDAWRRAIERAMADVQWRDKLAQQARQDVEQYTWRRRVQRVVSSCLPVFATPSGALL